MIHMTDAATAYSEIKKNGFDLKYLMNMTTGTFFDQSLDQFRRSLINTSSVPNRRNMNNCISVDFFQSQNIVHATKSFRVPFEKFCHWIELTGNSIATVRDSSPPSKPISEYMDIIFIESAKDPERMIPFVYVESYKYATLNGYEWHHEFVNEAVGWNFCIVQDAIMTATQRVTGLPPSLPHPTLQGVIDQNEIARIIKQFSDDINNGAYHIE